MTKQNDKQNITSSDNELDKKGTENDVKQQPQTVEKGGPKGPEPTRFGDWESNGRCTDFLSIFLKMDKLR